MIREWMTDWMVSIFFDYCRYCLEKLYSYQSSEFGESDCTFEHKVMSSSKSERRPALRQPTQAFCDRCSIISEMWAPRHCTVLLLLACVCAFRCLTARKLVRERKKKKKKKQPKTEGWGDGREEELRRGEQRKIFFMTTIWICLNVHAV